MKSNLIILLVAILIIPVIFSAGAYAYPYTIVTVGDWDCNSDTEKTVANIQKVNPDIILSTGDMSYESSADCWLELIAPFKDKVLISQGNHDDNYEDYMAAMGVTGKWFAKEVPEANAVFVSINTEEDLDAGSEQLAFLDKTLTDTKMAWKIPFMHKPSITYGHHPSSEGSPETLLPLYDKTKTSIEFSGHNHFMQEIYPTITGPKKVAAGEGTVHIVSGGGGRDLYDFKTNEVVAQSKADHGIVKTVLVDDKTAKNEFISNDGTVTPMADIINRNTPVIGPPPPPPLEICDNGIDDDLDGLIDKDDVIDCPTTPPPPPPPPVEICGDGIDNDGDGQIDENCPIDPPPPPPPINTSQILLTDLITSTTSNGSYTDPDHAKQYNVSNLFDNKINTYSFWVQRDLSSFTVTLGESLDKPICSIELDSYQPELKSQNYNIKMADTESEFLFDYKGVLDTNPEIINLDTCVTDMQQFGIEFTPVPPSRWTALSEVKLFTNSTIITPPPPPPPDCDPGYHLENGVCVPDTIPPPPPIINIGNGTFNITNSTVPISIDNANITINADTVRNSTDENYTESYDSPLKLSFGGVN